MDSQFPITGVPKQDLYLYDAYLGSAFYKVANTHPGPRDYCSYLLFKTAGDGLYEIALKVGEMHWVTNTRVYSVLIDDTYIVNEFVVQTHRKSPNGFELVINFKIFQNNTMLKLQGHPGEKIKRKDSRLRFEFCPSYCRESGYQKIDVEWLSTAMSIVKFAV